MTRTQTIFQAGGIVADLFVARQRGIAVALFMGATFMGQCIEKDSFVDR